jgi:hypothetical protein
MAILPIQWRRKQAWCDSAALHCKKQARLVTQICGTEAQKSSYLLLSTFQAQGTWLKSYSLSSFSLPGDLHGSVKRYVDEASGAVTAVTS